MGPLYLVILESELPIIILHYNESTETGHPTLVEAEIFNASIINGVILTYKINGGTVVEGAMYLHEGTYQFDIPAQLEPCVISFEVELSYHLKNRNMTESGLVTVAEGEADTITLHLGPVKDSEGNSVSGALVQVWINEEMEEGPTDDEGYAYFEVDPDVIGQEIDIKISKDGYRNLEFSAVVLEDGSLSGPIPTFDKETNDDGLPVAIIIIGILMVFLVLAILIFLILKKKGPQGSNEEQIEEPIGEQPLEVSDNPPSIQEEPVKEILEAQQEHPLDNSQERPILESPQEQPQLPEEDIQNQQVPETDLVSLEEPPVEEVISDEAPLASSEQMPMGDNLSTESGPSQTI